MEIFKSRVVIIQRWRKLTVIQLGEDVPVCVNEGAAQWRLKLVATPDVHNKFDDKDTSFKIYVVTQMICTSKEQMYSVLTNEQRAHKMFAAQMLC